MRVTFDVGRVTVHEYMLTYQENIEKIHILIRFKNIIDKIVKLIYSANDNF